MFTRYFRYSFLFIILAEIFSYFGYLLPDFNQIAFWVIVGLTLILSLLKLEYGFFILLAELFIGSKGYLFSLEIGGIVISIRLALFLVVLGVWIYNLKSQISNLKSILNLKSYISLLTSRFSLLKWYFFLFLFIAWGILNGFLKGNSFDNIFFDANGWLYFALLGVFLSVINSQEKIEQILQVFLASLLALSLKTLFLLFIFTHDSYLVAIPTFYQWVRLTGVGEITTFDNFSRIFIQSQLYILIGFFVLLGMLIFTELRKVGDFLYLFVLTILTAATLLISFSRSFWIAAVVGLIILYFIIAWPGWKNVLKLTIILSTVGILGLGLVFGITNLPILGSQGNFSPGMLEERTRLTGEEPAVASRWTLLKPLGQKIIKHPFLGSGFGSTVTFKTEDPRFLEKYPSGRRTTYAFEWGYLDIWLKIGLVGLFVYLWLVGMILLEGIRQFKIQNSKFKIQNNNLKLKIDQRLELITGLSLGLIVLLITNIFSPYLNHPLGIGYLMLVSAIFNSKIKNQNP